MTTPGPTLPTGALQQGVGCLRYTGRDANVVAKAARDPFRTPTVHRGSQMDVNFCGAGSNPLFRE
jgi:hypothetical protein